MKRVAGVAAGLTLLVALLSGCGTTTPASPQSSTSSAAPTTIRVASLKGPTTMGLVKLMDDAEKGLTAHDYQVTMYGAPDKVAALVAKGDYDIAMIPSNLASVLYNKTRTEAGPQVQVAAINTLGVLELVEAGDSVKTVADLKGKTIYTMGKGAVPEYVLNYLLTANGLDPAKDVTLEFKSEPTEVAALLASKPGALGVLPQPFVNVVEAQNPKVRTALSFSDEWAKVAPDSQLVSGVAVVRTEFAEQNRAAVDDFLSDYEASTEFTNAKPRAAATLIAKAGIVPSVPIALGVIPACNVTYLEGAELERVLGGFLQVLFEADQASVGGSMPSDDFYYRR